jgi:gamma-glutamyltranspeptidase/glutathione hydrolase/leukotriene-C4 hydrolase
VDAAIAALLVNGLTNAHSMGIGGGFVMTIWCAEEKKAYALIAREWAPSSSTEDMYKGNGTLARAGTVIQYSPPRSPRQLKYGDCLH